MSGHDGQIPERTAKTIHQTIIAVMRDVDAIAKSRENTMQKFRFRGIDDLYNALHPVMARHGLYSFPRVVSESAEDRTSKNGGVNIYRMLSIEFDFCNEDGDKITVGPIIGEAMDSGDKAANKAHSIAHKYALLQLFCIPTEDDKDPDATSYDIAGPESISSVLVTNCERKGTPEKPVFVVSFSNGGVASTFSATLAKIAKEAFDTQRPVTISVKRNGEFFSLEAIA